MHIKKPKHKLGRHHQEEWGGKREEEKEERGEEKEGDECLERASDMFRVW